MTPSLRCEDLQLTFPDGTTVGPLTLDLGPGVHHLQGQNGCGKSTLLRCLCSEFRPTAGTVRVCERDPQDDAQARREIALLASAPELPDLLTVDEAWQQLAAIRGRPDWDGNALRDTLDVPGRLLLGHCSAGQRRRAELLAAAAGDPVVLLLDEAFANLDPESTRRVVDVLEGWRTQRVLLLTSHRPLPLPTDSVHTLSRPRPGDTP